MSDTVTERPPLGVIPFWLYIENRICDLDAAIERYKSAFKEIPQKLIDERYDLSEWLSKNKHVNTFSLQAPAVQEKDDAPMEEEWISVDKKLPPRVKDDFSYTNDCIVKDMKGIEMVAYYHHTNFAWYQEQDDKPYPQIHHVTHWKPIKAASQLSPKEK